MLLDADSFLLIWPSWVPAGNENDHCKYLFKVSIRRSNARQLNAQKSCACFLLFDIVRMLLVSTSA